MLERYENTLNELKNDLVKEIKDGIRSIVVYGSVARKEAGEDSDIDVLVVLKDHSLYRKVSDIIYEIDLKNRTATSLFWVTAEELTNYAKNGSPFTENVVEEGIILYDDGTFARVRQSIARVINRKSEIRNSNVRNNFLMTKFSNDQNKFGSIVRKMK